MLEDGMMAWIKTPSMGPEAGCPHYSSNTMLELWTGEAKTGGTCRKRQKIATGKTIRSNFLHYLTVRLLGLVVCNDQEADWLWTTLPLMKQNRLPTHSAIFSYEVGVGVKAAVVKLWNWTWTVKMSHLWNNVMNRQEFLTSTPVSQFREWMSLQNRI